VARILSRRGRWAQGSEKEPGLIRQGVITPAIGFAARTITAPDGQGAGVSLQLQCALSWTAAQSPLPSLRARPGESLQRA